MFQLSSSNVGGSLFTLIHNAKTASERELSESDGKTLYLIAREQYQHELR